MPMQAQKISTFKGLSVGYINKDWASAFPDGSYHENIFGEEGKRLHGVQVALNYTVCMPIGLGINTGLAYEWCFSYSKKVEEMGFDRFNEHSLYLPLHATWAIPVSRKATIAPFAGVGFNWKMSANMKKGVYDGFWTSDYYMNRRFRSHDDFSRIHYGENGWPHALNAQLEFGVNVFIDGVHIGFTYSRGLTDHKFYRSDNVKTRQDKLALTFGFFVP